MARLIDRRFVAGFVSVFVLLAGGFGIMATRPAETVPNPEPAQAFDCTVVSVYDGDGPIHCREGQSIRLSGIAAREMNGSCNANQPCPRASAIEARDALRQLVSGRVLQCRRVGTSYNRVVASCSVGGRDVACAMIASGTVLRWARYDPERRLERC